MTRVSTVVFETEGRKHGNTAAHQLPEETIDISEKPWKILLAKWIHVQHDFTCLAADSIIPLKISIPDEDIEFDLKMRIHQTIPAILSRDEEDEEAIFMLLPDMNVVVQVANQSTPPFDDENSKMKRKQSLRKLKYLENESREYNLFREIILLPVIHPEVFARLGLQAGFIKGVLLSGPPGVGKTRAVRELMYEVQTFSASVRLFSVHSAEKNHDSVSNLLSTVFLDAYKFLMKHSTVRSLSADEAAATFRSHSKKQLSDTDLLSTPQQVPKDLTKSASSGFSFKSFSKELHSDSQRSQTGSSHADIEDRGRRSKKPSRPKHQVHADARAIIYIDELDMICGKRASVSDSRSGPGSNVSVLSRLLTLMDGEFSNQFVEALKSSCELLFRKITDVKERRRFLNHVRQHIIVVGSTNAINDIDPALRRPGRFDKEILFRPPSISQRVVILKHLAKQQLSGSLYSLEVSDAQYRRLAEHTVGFVGADLLNLVLETKRIVSVHPSTTSIVHQNLSVTDMAFHEALKRVGVAASQRSVARQRSELLSKTASEVNCVDESYWAEIAGYDAVKQKMTQSILWPIRHAQEMKKFNLQPVRGVLFYGPPGCAKTTFARTISRIMSTNFITLDIADVYSSPYFGESERRIREVFETARLALPSIVFIDEIDAIITNRFGSGGSENNVAKRILSTLLNEMDGIQNSEGLIVLGATNRIEQIDRALLRPGRFDVKIEITLPDTYTRYLIMRLYLSQMSVSASLSEVFTLEDASKLMSQQEFQNRVEDGSQGFLQQLMSLTSGFSGADLQNLCKQCGMLAIREDLEAVTEAIIVEALKRYRQS